MKTRTQTFDPNPTAYKAERGLGGRVKILFLIYALTGLILALML